MAPKRSSSRPLKPKPRPGSEATAAAAAAPSKKTWSEDDCLLILKNLVKFKSKHGGKEPTTKEDFSVVADLVRKHHCDEFSVRQLGDKVRKLRARFFFGGNANFSDESNLTGYEKSALDLAQRIWATSVEEKVEVEGEEEVVVTENATEAKRRRRNAKSPKRTKSSSGEKNTNDNKNINAAAALLDVEEVEHGLYPTLVEAVVALENEASNGSRRGTFERAVKVMKPANARVWEEKLKNQCLAEMEIQRKRKVLESGLLGELEGILNS